MTACHSVRSGRKTTHRTCTDHYRWAISEWLLGQLPFRPRSLWSLGASAAFLQKHQQIDQHLARRRESGAAHGTENGKKRSTAICVPANKGIGLPGRPRAHRPVGA